MLPFRFYFCCHRFLTLHIHHYIKFLQYHILLILISFSSLIALSLISESVNPIPTFLFNPYIFNITFSLKTKRANNSIIYAIQLKTITYTLLLSIQLLYIKNITPDMRQLKTKCIKV